MATWDSVENSQHIRDQILNLIKLKSDRDRVDFSLKSLADAIKISSSIFYKLLRDDEAKKTKYISKNVLKKITDYFQSEGFNISLDEILGSKKVYIEDTRLTPEKTKTGIKIFDSNNCLICIGKIDTDIELNFADHDIIGYKFEEFIPPFFPSGSIWFADADKEPENDTICAFKFDNKVVLKRYLIAKNEILLGDLNKGVLKTEKYTVDYKLIGEIIKVKTPSF